MTFSSHAGKLLALDVHGLPLKVPALFNLFFIPCLACLRVVVNTTADAESEPTQSYAATDIPIQPVENGTPSHSSAILSQVPVSETETHAIDSISRRDPPTIMEISAATTGEPESTLQPVDVHPIRVESESFSIHLPEIEVHPRISDQSEETVWGGNAIQ